MVVDDNGTAAGADKNSSNGRTSSDKNVIGRSVENPLQQSQEPQETMSVEKSDKEITRNHSNPDDAQAEYDSTGTKVEAIPPAPTSAPKTAPAEDPVTADASSSPSSIDEGNVQSQSSPDTNHTSTTTEETHTPPAPPPTAAAVASVPSPPHDSFSMTASDDWVNLVPISASSTPEIVEEDAAWDTSQISWLETSLDSSVNVTTVFVEGTESIARLQQQQQQQQLSTFVSEGNQFDGDNLLSSASFPALTTTFLENNDGFLEFSKGFDDDDENDDDDDDALHNDHHQHEKNDDDNEEILQHDQQDLLEHHTSPLDDTLPSQEERIHSYLHQSKDGDDNDENSSDDDDNDDDDNDENEEDDDQREDEQEIQFTSFGDDNDDDIQLNLLAPPEVTESTAVTLPTADSDPAPSAIPFAQFEPQCDDAVVEHGRKEQHVEGQIDSKKLPEDKGAPTANNSDKSSTVKATKGEKGKEEDASGPLPQDRWDTRSILEHPPEQLNRQEDQHESDGRGDGDDDEKLVMESRESFPNEMDPTWDASRTEVFEVAAEMAKMSLETFKTLSETSETVVASESSFWTINETDLGGMDPISSNGTFGFGGCGNDIASKGHQERNEVNMFETNEESSEKRIPDTVFDAVSMTMVQMSLEAANTTASERAIAKEADEGGKEEEASDDLQLNDDQDLLENGPTRSDGVETADSADGLPSQQERIKIYLKTDHANDGDNSSIDDEDEDEKGTEEEEEEGDDESEEDVQYALHDAASNWFDSEEPDGDKVEIAANFVNVFAVFDEAAAAAEAPSAMTIAPSNGSDTQANKREILNILGSKEEHEKVNAQTQKPKFIPLIAPPPEEKLRRWEESRKKNFVYQPTMVSNLFLQNGGANQLDDLFAADGGSVHEAANDSE